MPIMNCGLEVWVDAEDLKKLEFMVCTPFGANGLEPGIQMCCCSWPTACSSAVKRPWRCLCFGLAWQRT